MSAPTDRLRALFSGVPAPQRDRLLLMSVQQLQAFVDVSKTREEVLVLGGYIARFDQWERFSLDWQALLDEPPAWSRFSMSEIGKRHMERAEGFYRLIEKHVMASMCVAVEIGALRHALFELGLSHRILSNPYLFAIRAFTDMAIQYQHEIGIKEEPIEFIFDERGEEKHVKAGWETYVESLPEHLKARVSKRPRFENDMKFRPLQAADLFAWHARKHWLKHRTLVGPSIDVSWKKERDIPGHRFNFGLVDIRKNLRRLRTRMVENGLIPSVTMSVTFSIDLSDPKKRS